MLCNGQNIEKKLCFRLDGEYSNIFCSSNIYRAHTRAWFNIYWLYVHSFLSEQTPLIYLRARVYYEYWLHEFYHSLIGCIELLRDARNDITLPVLINIERMSPRETWNWTISLAIYSATLKRSDIVGNTWYALFDGLLTGWLSKTESYKWNFNLFVFSIWRWSFPGQR